MFLIERSDRKDRDNMAKRRECAEKQAGEKKLKQVLKENSSAAKTRAKKKDAGKVRTDASL